MTSHPVAAKSIDEQSIDKFTRESLREYGSYVVEERAVPDLRDGMKPSHRAITWAMACLNLRSNVKAVKAARVVGDAIGRFHPHGDSGVYGAMVTLANTAVPIVQGQGNWGSPIDNAAAYRYTEARMSKFADFFMLDRDYLKVVPYVENYSREERWPLYLPALLPFLLLNGSPPIPAYGVSAGNPAFSLKSVAKVVVAGLNGTEIDARMLAKTLVPVHEFGCEVLPMKKEYREIMSTGRGSLVHRALVTGDQKGRRIVISSFVPGAMASAVACEKTLNTLAALTNVKRAYSQKGKRTKGSGPYGACYVVETAKLQGAAWDELVAKVTQKVTSKVSVRLGVTIRHISKPNSFHYLSFVKMMQAWIKYRIDLEVKLLKHQIADVEKRIHVQEVYIWAVDNMKALLAALPKVLVANDPVKALAKVFKLSVDDANIILQRKIIQLAKMEREALDKLLKELKAELKGYKRGLKEPGAYAAEKTSTMVAKYLKNPDLPRSHV